MHRRGFLAAAGGLLPTLRARADDARVPLVGFATSGIVNAISISYQNAIKDGLRSLGDIDGRDFRYLGVNGNGRFESFPSLAAKLIAMQPEVIVTPNAFHAAEVARQTKEIPIIFITGGDAVVIPLVGTFARPKSNVTGIMLSSTDDRSKLIEVFHN